MTPLRGVRAAEDRARRRDRICPAERRPTAQTTARGKIFAAGEIPVRHPLVGAALFVSRRESTQRGVAFHITLYSLVPRYGFCG